MNTENKNYNAEVSKDIDKKADHLYGKVSEDIQRELNGWGYELRNYDKTRLKLLCREVMAQFEQLIASYEKAHKVGEGVFIPLQEVKERFYFWLKQNGPEEVVKRIREREDEYTKFLQENYHKE